MIALLAGASGWSMLGGEIASMKPLSERDIMRSTGGLWWIVDAQDAGSASPKGWAGYEGRSHGAICAFGRPLSVLRMCGASSGKRSATANRRPKQPAIIMSPNGTAK
jgi:hypothetical protein